MASAKKGKKNKGKTLALSDFLQETPGTVATVPIRKSTTNWADEVEDNHDVYDPRSSKASVVLPTAPKASRDFDDIIDKVPQDPPYIAYLTNLPYDVDEAEISYFFRNMKIGNMRIPKDDRAGEVPRLKGFGYVEFEDRESLLNALVIPDTTIKNRRIRIEVATDYGNDNRRGGRMDMNRDRGNRSEMSSLGDWRSGPRQESSSSDMERRGFSRDRDRDREREGSDSSSMWRDAERRQPPPRDSDRSFARSNDRYRGGDDRDSDFGRSRDDNKFSSRRFDSDRDRDRDRGGDRPRNGGGGFTRDGGGGGFTRDGGGGGFTRDGGSGGGGFTRDGGGGGGGFTRDGGGGGGGFTRDGGGGGGGFTRGPPPPSRDDDNKGGGRDEMRQRPKLMLTPRTKPVEGEPEKVASSTSIFGNAKPVDTAARERQIEERLAKDHDPAPKRDASRERKEPEKEGKEKEKDKVLDTERKPEREKATAHSPPDAESDINGVVEKSQPLVAAAAPQQQAPHPHPKRSNGDHDKKEARAVEGDKHKSEVRKKDEKKEKTEKEMPKLKKTEPPNFVASNKFAYLQNEDSSD